MADRYKIGVKVLELSGTKEVGSQWGTGRTAEGERSGDEGLVFQLPDSTNSIACSEDGKYLSLGHPRGLSVWCVCGLVWAAEWLKDRQEIIAVQMVSMSPEAYLIGTIDYMGRYQSDQTDRSLLLAEFISFRTNQRSCLQVLPGSLHITVKTFTCSTSSTVPWVLCFCLNFSNI